MSSVTLKEIAAEAGVSIYTVSRVLNGKTKEAYAPAIKRAQHIRQVAKRLGFVPNSSARAIRSKQTRVVGVFMHSDPMATLVDQETILGINTGLMAAGYILAITRSSKIPESTDLHDPALKKTFAAKFPRLFSERMVDGMIVLGPIPLPICEMLERIAPACLWLDSNVDKTVNCIRRDEYHSGRTVALQMVNRGYKQLVYVNPYYSDEPRHYSLIDRAKGIADVAKENHCGMHEIRVTAQSYKEISKELPPLLTPQTGVIVSNDRQAVALISQLSPRGIKPGIDFALAACDCAYPVRASWPELACMDVKRYELGLQTAEMMLQILKNPQHESPAKIIQWGWHEGGTILACP